MIFEVRVLYDFIASEKDELHVSSGELLEVLSTEDDPWWLCKNSKGHQGMAPSNYLERLGL